MMLAIYFILSYFLVATSGAYYGLYILNAETGFALTDDYDENIKLAKFTGDRTQQWHLTCSIMNEATGEQLALENKTRAEDLEPSEWEKVMTKQHNDYNYFFTLTNERGLNVDGTDLYLLVDFKTSPYHVLAGSLEERELQEWEFIFV